MESASARVRRRRRPSAACEPRRLRSARAKSAFAHRARPREAHAGEVRGGSLRSRERRVRPYARLCAAGKRGRGARARLDRGRGARRPARARRVAASFAPRPRRDGAARGASRRPPRPPTTTTATATWFPPRSRRAATRPRRAPIQPADQVGAERALGPAAVCGGAHVGDFLRAARARGAYVPRSGRARRRGPLEGRRFAHAHKTAASRTPASSRAAQRPSALTRARLARGTSRWRRRPKAHAGRADGDAPGGLGRVRLRAPTSTVGFSERQRRGNPPGATALIGRRASGADLGWESRVEAPSGGASAPRARRRLARRPQRAVRRRKHGEKAEKKWNPSGGALAQPLPDQRCPWRVPALCTGLEPTSACRDGRVRERRLHAWTSRRFLRTNDECTSPMRMPRCSRAGFGSAAARSRSSSAARRSPPRRRARRRTTARAVRRRAAHIPKRYAHGGRVVLAAVPVRAHAGRAVPDVRGVPGAPAHRTCWAPGARSSRLDTASRASSPYAYSGRARARSCAGTTCKRAWRVRRVGSSVCA